jgi:S1-C subfamily serine protease
MQPPASRRQSKQEGSRQQRRFESPLQTPPPRLGITWSPSDPVNGLLVTQVKPGTPARAAGLSNGDRITAVDDRAILDHDRFREEIRAASEPLTLSVLRNGASEPVAIQVKLAGKPLRLGISWRGDAASPGVVMLVRVAPHSPGGRAGLQVHDRLYEMNGRTADTAEDFLAHALETELPITFLVERGGQFRTVTLRTYDDYRQRPR